MSKSITLKDGTIIKQKKAGYNWPGLIIVLIPLIAFIVFSIVPIAVSVYSSFTTMQNYSNKFEVVKWAKPFYINYFNVFQDVRFWHSIGLAFYVTLGQFTSLTIALVMSVLLSSKVKGWNVFSAIYFIPYICSSVASSIIWQNMFATRNGIINEIIIMLGGTRQDFVNNQYLYPLIFIFIQAWSAPGYGIIMYNAAFAAVDDTLYEAARIDGASRSRQFWSITMPSISPTTYFLVMLAFIAGLQQFELVKVFTGFNSFWGTYGAGELPYDMGLMPLLYVYDTMTVSGNHMSEATAMSWIIFFIVFATSKLDEKFSKVWVANEYE